MLNITPDQARQFILLKQGLLGRHRFAGKDGAYQYVRQAGCIQYDPVDVCGRNAELTLQSRVKGFTKRMLDDLLYRDRLLVDYADKELSIWPSEDWPYFASYRERSMTLGKTFSGIPELEEEAIRHIRANGPVSSDSLPLEGTVFWHSSMHWSGHWHKESPAARSVLEQLYTDGVLLIPVRMSPPGWTGASFAGSAPSACSGTVVPMPGWESAWPRKSGTPPSPAWKRPAGSPRSGWKACVSRCMC